MKKVLVLFSLALIQGCLVSNKEFEELDSDSSFFTSAQSIKCMQMVTPQQPTPINDKGDTIEQAIPSTPVEILGMNGPAKAGDDFIVVENESKAKEINAYRKENLQSEKNSLVFATQDSAFKDNKVKELK